jgi:hypothetical protein
VKNLGNAVSLLDSKIERVSRTTDRHTEYLRATTYKQVDAEARQRRNNLIFRGLAENPGENCFELIRDFMRNHLDLDPGAIYLSRAHRLGRRSHNRISRRPIIVNFRDYCDTEMIMNRAHMLKSTPFSVDIDLPREIQNARSKLWPDFKKLKNEAPRSKIQIVYPAKLIQDGKLIHDALPEWDRYTQIDRFELLDRISSRAEGSEAANNTQQQSQFARAEEQELVNQSQTSTNLQHSSCSEPRIPVSAGMPQIPLPVPPQPLMAQLTLNSFMNMLAASLSQQCGSFLPIPVLNNNSVSPPNDTSNERQSCQIETQTFPTTDIIHTNNINSISPNVSTVQNVSPDPPDPCVQSTHIVDLANQNDINPISVNHSIDSPTRNTILPPNTLNSSVLTTSYPEHENVAQISPSPVINKPAVCVVPSSMPNFDSDETLLKHVPDSACQHIDTPLAQRVTRGRERVSGISRSQKRSSSTKPYRRNSVSSTRENTDLGFTRAKNSSQSNNPGQDHQAERKQATGSSVNTGQL